MKQIKKLLSILLAIALSLPISSTLGVTAEAAAYAFSGGSGTETDPYRISTVQDLKDVNNKMVSEKTNLSGVYFVMTDDIDLLNEPFTPIGLVSPSAWRYFKGVFDGSGFEVRNLNVGSGGLYAGLFAYVSSAKVKNVTVNRGTVSGVDYAGALAGYVSDSEIENCHNIDVDVRTTGYSGNAGGLAGGLSSIGFIRDSSSKNADITGTYAGGIVGQNVDAAVINCYNNSTVHGRNVGGIVAQAGSDSNYPAVIDSCNNTGSVFSGLNLSNLYVGGIVGIVFNNYTGTPAYINNNVNSGSIGFEPPEMAFVNQPYLGGIIGALSKPGRVFAYNNYNVGAINTQKTGINAEIIADYLNGATVPTGFNQSYTKANLDSSGDRLLSTLNANAANAASIGITYNYPGSMSSWEMIPSISPYPQLVNNPGNPQVHAITSWASSGGTISPVGTTVTSTGALHLAFAPDSGYEISDIKIDGISVSTDVLNRCKAQNKYSFTNLRRDRSIEVIFSKIQYNIGVTPSANGEINVSGNKVKAESGETLSLTVTPSPGYVLVEGSLKFNGTTINVSQNGTASFTMPAFDVVLSAEFSKKMHNVTAKSTGNGTITPSGVVSVADGGQQVFTFSPATGYELDKLKVDGTEVTVSGNTSNPSYTLTNVTSNKIIEVSFKKKSYTVQFVGVNGLLITNYTVLHGESFSIPTAPVVSGFEFSGFYTEPNGNGTKLEAPLAVTENLTYYGKYTPVSDELITVTFYTTSGNKTVDVTVKKGSAVPHPFINDNKFLGWSKTRDGNIVPYSEFKNVLESAAYYAVFSKADGQGALTVTGYVYIKTEENIYKPAEGYVIKGTKQTGNGNLEYTSVIDANGMFSFTNNTVWENGGYRLTLTDILGREIKTGNILFSTNKNLHENTVVEIITLSGVVGEENRLDVKLEAYLNGKPLSGLSTMLKPSSGQSMVVQTDEYGLARYVSIPYESTGTLYEASCSYNGETITASLSVPIDNHYIFNFYSKYSIGGTVRVGGVPKAGVLLECDVSGGKLYAITDDEGRYIFNRLDNGSFTVTTASKEYQNVSKQAIINDADATLDFDLPEPFVLKGKVYVNGNLSYPGAVGLYKDDILLPTAPISKDGYEIKGIVNQTGNYELRLLYILDSQGKTIDFIQSDAIFDITALTGTLVKDIHVNEKLHPSLLITGEVKFSNNISATGNTETLIIKYTNNGSTDLKNVAFNVSYSKGLTKVGGDSEFVGTIKAGESGSIKIAVKIASTADRYQTADVDISYDDNGGVFFGSDTLEIISLDINGPRFVNVGEQYTLYGYGPKDTEIRVICLETTQEQSTVVNGRWYSVYNSEDKVGVTNYVAETVIDGVTIRSNIHTVKAQSVPFLTNAYSNGGEIKINPTLKMAPLNAWVNGLGNGLNLNLGAKFAFPGGTIHSVVYEFDLARPHLSVNNAKDSQNRWLGQITDWRGSGTRKIIAILQTDQGEFRIPAFYATILIDPSGKITDSETGLPLSGVTVLCEESTIYDPQTGTPTNEDESQWRFWDAELYGQQNPQVSQNDGGYGWMTPEGKYRVVAKLDGYRDFYTTAEENIKPIYIMPIRDDVNITMTPLNPTTAINMPKALTLSLGETKVLETVVIPVQKQAVYTVSNSGVIDIASNGVITAKSYGTSTVTAKVGNITAQTFINVGTNQSVEPQPTPEPIPEQTQSPSYNDTSSESSNHSASASTTPSPTKTSSPVEPVTVSKNAQIKALAEKNSIVLLDTAQKGVLDKPLTVTYAVGKENAGRRLYVSFYNEAKERLEHISEVVCDKDGKINFTTKTGGSFAISEIVLKGTYVTLSQKTLASSIYSFVPFLSKGGKDSYVKLSTVLEDGIGFIAPEDGLYQYKFNPHYFSDIKDHKAQDAIYFTAARELFFGIGDNLFAPEKEMTRAMFATVLSRLDEGDMSIYSKETFTDVAPNAYYAQPIAWAYDKAIIKGYGGGLFGPDDYVTGEQMTIMISNYLSYKKLNLETVDLNEFADIEPKSNVDRAQVAQALLALIDKLVQGK